MEPASYKAVPAPIREALKEAMARYKADEYHCKRYQKAACEEVAQKYSVAIAVLEDLAYNLARQQRQKEKRAARSRPSPVPRPLTKRARSDNGSESGSLATSASSGSQQVLFVPSCSLNSSSSFAGEHYPGRQSAERG
jgi:hypothetical protein